MNTKSGFGTMTPEQRKAVSSKGGRAAHAKGTAHRFTPETASAAGRISHANGTAHQWTPDAAREAARKSKEARDRNRAAENTTSEDDS